MDDSGLDIVGDRRNGIVVGYAWCENHESGACLDHIESFYENQNLPESGNLADAKLLWNSIRIVSLPCSGMSVRIFLCARCINRRSGCGCLA